MTLVGRALAVLLLFDICGGHGLKYCDLRIFSYVTLLTQCPADKQWEISMIVDRNAILGERAPSRGYFVAGENATGSG